MRERLRIGLLVGLLLAAVLVVGLTSDAEGSGRPPADKPAWVAEQVETMLDGMSCVGVSADGLLLVVCQRKVDLG